MNDPFIVYSVNLIIGVILAGVMSRYWRLEARGGALRYWIVAAWTLSAADLGFVLRSAYPDTVTRMLPTLMVTAGQLMLIFASQRSTGQPTERRAGGAVLALHALFLLGFVLFPQFSSWRSVGNAIVWGSLSFRAAWVLSRPIGDQRTAMQLPAFVLVSHGLFHLLRLTLATLFASQQDSAAGAVLQLIGDLEVSLFMVALFVSVLVAFLELSHRELSVAADNVRQLASMLPLCAWCGNVRDDDGYWKRIEAYLATHQVSVTHGICESCSSKHFVAQIEPQKS